MDHSKFIASIQKVESIGSFKSAANYYSTAKSELHTKSCEFHAAASHWIVFTANHAIFMLKAHLLWKVSMESIFSN